MDKAALGEQLAEAGALDGLLRRSGIAPIGDVAWGTHFCHFYEELSDLIEIVIPYFRAGLENNECCLWLACDPCPPEQARQELLKAIPAAQMHLDAGAIEIIACDEWYLPSGIVEPERLLQAWQERLDQALARGYDGLRVHANESWLTRKTWQTFAQYERSLDSMLRGRRILVVCTYPLAGCSGSEVFDVAATHQFTIARRRGEWEVLETVELIAAKAEVERLNRELRAWVDQRTRQLAAADAALHEREDLYHFLTENTTDLITLYDLKGRRVYESPSVARMLGQLPAVTFGGVHPDDMELARAAWQRVASGEASRITLRHRDANEAWRWLEATGARVHYQGAPHVMVVGRDVTERVRLEEQLRQAQKMEAVGRLAGGVAHDFNNLLTAILGYADLAVQDLPPDTAAAGDLAEIRSAAERARGVTRQLLAFSRKQIIQPQVVDVGTALRGVERMLRLLLREDLHFEIRTESRPLRVWADPIQIEQLLLNLAVNARDATPPGGSITIETTRVDAQPQHAGVPAYVRAGPYVRVRVTDTGSGMPPEVAERVFEPFFTTKPAGIGTGLGLSTVYGIVKQSDGFIWLESEPGRGTTFTVLLPASADTPEPTAAPTPAHRPDLRGRTVALVEDEDAVRHFAAEVLRRSGLRVLDFAAPAAALRALADPAVHVDALVTDVVLPEIRGPELVQRLRANRPDLAVVYITGYKPEDIALDEQRDTVTILEKPFGAADLIRHLAAVLD